MAEDPQSTREGGGHRRMRQLAAALADGVVLVAPDRTIAWANEAALRMHGVGAAAELGRTVSEYRERFGVRHRDRHGAQATTRTPAQSSGFTCSSSRTSGRVSCIT